MNNKISVISNTIFEYEENLKDAEDMTKKKGLFTGLFSGLAAAMY